jgi:hypothetical protein
MKKLLLEPRRSFKFYEDPYIHTLERRQKEKPQNRKARKRKKSLAHCWCQAAEGAEASANEKFLIIISESMKRIKGDPNTKPPKGSFTRKSKKQFRLYRGRWRQHMKQARAYKMLPWAYSKGGHGLPKVLLGPTMPYASTPCGRPPLKRPYGRFRAGRPQSGQLAAVI